MTGLTAQAREGLQLRQVVRGWFSEVCGDDRMAIEDAKEAMEKYDTEMPFVRQLNERCDKAGRSRATSDDRRRSHAFNKWE